MSTFEETNGSSTESRHLQTMLTTSSVRENTQIIPEQEPYSSPFQRLAIPERDYSEEEAPNPTQIQWALKPLYKISQIGKLQVWQIGFDLETNMLETYHGYVDGKIQKDTKKVETNQSNRTMQEQGWLEAKSKYLLKYRGGYRPPGDEMDGSLKPQLAHKYIPPTQPKGSGEYYITKFPVVIQPKIDGIRALVELDGNTVQLKSRTGISFKWLDHISQELFRFFPYLPRGVRLDGELYNHNPSFNQIISIVRRQKTKHPKNDEILYYIYDLMIPETPTEQRYEILRKAFNSWVKDNGPSKYIRVILSTVVGSNEEIEEHHRKYVGMGYEGLMIRRFGYTATNLRETKMSWYKGNRNQNLLKYKHFQDEEGLVIDVLSGEGREDGLALFKVRDPRGNELTIRPRGKFEQRKRWLQEKDECIGKQYTYRFFGLSEYDIPRFPTGKGFRDYE